MRGSITEFEVGQGCGSILAEDGCEVYFDKSSFSGFDFRRLSVGEWVEFEEQYFGARWRAVKIRPLQTQVSPRSSASDVSMNGS